MLINQRDGVSIWGTESEVIDFNMDIESVEITHSIDAGVPDATIKFKTPKYGAKKYIAVEGYETAILNYSEVEIYLKGRFLVKTKNSLTGQYDYKANYYRAFHGYAQHFSDDFTLNCVGYLDIWRKVYLNFDPTSPNFFIFGSETKPFVLNGKNVFEAIYAIIAKNEEPFSASESDLTQFWLGLGVANAKVSQEMIQDVASYWQYYFNLVKKNIAFFDNNLITQLNSTLHDTFTSTTNNNESYTSNTSTAIIKFMPDMLLSYYQQTTGINKFEVLKEITKNIMYEFYQDTNGTIVIKPEFYNLDTRNIRQNVIDAQDIINFNYTYNFGNLFSKMTIKGSLIAAEGANTDPIVPTGIYTDINTMKKYGINMANETYPWLTDARACALLAKIKLHKNNFLEAKTGSMTVTLRPELRLGYPIYNSKDDLFVYPNSIRHTIVWGQNANTEITFNSVRTPFISEKLTTYEKNTIQGVKKYLDSWQHEDLDLNNPIYSQFLANSDFTTLIANAPQTDSPSGQANIFDNFNIQTNNFIIVQQQTDENTGRIYYSLVFKDKITVNSDLFILKGDLARKLRLKYIVNNAGVTIENSIPNPAGILKSASMIYDKRGQYIRLKGDLNAKLFYIDEELVEAILNSTKKG